MGELSLGEVLEGDLEGALEEDVLGEVGPGAVGGHEEVQNLEEEGEDPSLEGAQEGDLLVDGVLVGAFVGVVPWGDPEEGASVGVDRAEVA